MAKRKKTIDEINTPSFRKWMQECDYQNAIDFAVKKAVESFQKEEVIKPVAKNLKKEGYSINLIASVTELSAEEIEKL